MIKHFEINEKGNDYVVGDIHGCFPALRKQLAELNFNKDVDRLYCVGDLVDRGPQSELALEWLNYPWFFSALGNHEQMAIDAYEDGNVGLHFHSGGEWFYALPVLLQKEFSEAFKKLPIAIEVQTKDGIIGIVHGECPVNNWDDMWVYLGDNIHWQYFKNNCIWGRDRINRNITSMVEGVNMVYVGHTIVPTPIVLGNVHYTDTGAFLGNPLTILKIN